MTFGEKLKELRKDREITQGQLSLGSDIPFYTIVALENNRSKSPLITTVIRLAKYFQITIEVLLEEVEF